MDRQAAQWFYLIVGLVLWGIGVAGYQSFEPFTWPSAGAELLRTLGVVMLGATVFVGVWGSLRD